MCGAFAHTYVTNINISTEALALALSVKLMWSGYILYELYIGFCYFFFVEPHICFVFSFLANKFLSHSDIDENDNKLC